MQMRACYKDQKILNEHNDPKETGKEMVVHFTEVEAKQFLTHG